MSGGAGIVSGIGQGVVGLAAMRGAFNKDVSADPGPRNLASEYAQIAGAVRSAAPMALDLQRTYGPEYQAEEQRLLAATEEFYRRQHPGMAQAEDELLLGSSLNPAQERTVEQSVRAGQSARGMTRGSGAVYAETLAKSEYGDALYQQRFDRARQAIQTNPYWNLTGQMQPNYNALVFGNTYGQDVNSTNWNYAADKYLSDTAYNDAMKAGGMSTLAQSFSTAGGAGSGATFNTWKPSANSATVGPRPDAGSGSGYGGW